MGARRHLRAFVLCALALAGLGFAACAEDEEEPRREGLFLELDGLDYNVLLTRQLNPRLPEDEAYLDGPEAPDGSSYWGVFLRVCNEGDEPREAADDFEITDAQGNKFEPTEQAADNDFAYRAGSLPPNVCEPRRGSVADLGPGGAAILVFTLPNDTIENKPLELEIEGGSEASEGGGEHGLTIELDF
jgi:hypothetical protein